MINPPTTTAAYDGDERTDFDRFEAEYIRLAEENQRLRTELVRVWGLVPLESPTLDDVAF